MAIVRQFHEWVEKKIESHYPREVDIDAQLKEASTT